jgi:hypothetical protein
MAIMAKGNGHQDPRVTSLDEARRRAAQKAKVAEIAARAGAKGPRTWRDLLIGGIAILMAIGFLVSLVWPLVTG